MTDLTHPLAFCPPLHRMDTTGMLLGENGAEIKVGAIPTVSNLLELRRQILRLKPQRTLEIGLAYGASALAIIQSLRDVHGDGDWKHLSLDPFQPWNWQGAGRRIALELAGEQHFENIEEFSKYALPHLAQKKQRFGLIYIDGSHLFEDVLLDLYFSAELLEIGGVVLLDDCTDAHIAKVLRFCRRNYSDILVPEPIDTSHKSWLRRMANRLGYAQLRAFRKIAEPPRAYNAKFSNF